MGKQLNEEDDYETRKLILENRREIMNRFAKGALRGMKTPIVEPEAKTAK